MNPTVLPAPVAESAELTPGRRRAAITLVGLGPERAAAVLSTMDEREVREVTAAVLTLGPVSAEEIRDALADLATGLGRLTAVSAPGQDFARSALEKAFGPSRAAALVDDLTRPAPFAWLAGADPDVAAKVLTAEPPATSALALSHLDHVAGARLLSRMPAALRNDVAHRIATLESVNVETVGLVDTALRAKVGDTVRAPVTRVTGPAVLAGLLSNSPRSAERGVLTSLTETAPKIADAVRAQLLTFDDVLALPARDLAKILAAVEVRDLALALYGATPATLAAAQAAVSERNRALLEEEAGLLATVRGSEVKEARTKVVAAARELEEAGTIAIGRDDEDEA